MSDFFSLAKAQINAQVCIKTINNSVSGDEIRRLAELGFFCGKQIVIKRFSPLKKVIMVEIDKRLTCLRIDLAKEIYVE